MRLLALFVLAVACDGGGSGADPDDVAYRPPAFHPPPSGDLMSGDWILCDDPWCFELEDEGLRFSAGLIRELSALDRNNILGGYCVEEIGGTYEIMDGGARIRIGGFGTVLDLPLMLLPGSDQARLGGPLGDAAFLQRIHTTGYVDFCLE